MLQALRVQKNKGIEFMYHYDQRPGTQFSESAQSFMRDIQSSEYVVLCGRNNCGKSYLLKTLTQQIGERASYLGPARYQNFNVIGSFAPNRNQRRRTRKYQEFMNQWRNQQQNLDNSPFNLQQAIAELTNEKREQLIEIMQSLLGSKMELRHTVENNSMSQQYISVDGHNISFTSSGYRLITSLITSLLDEEFDTFFIDEPELGISPEAQGLFSDFLFNKEIRDRYFGHIKTLVLATHSTIFLDRNQITNNYFVEKDGDVIDITRVDNVSDINRMHFFLLGNRLETLYMPSSIVIVEGKSDYKFINRLLNVRYDNSNVSVIQANGDSRIKEIFNLTKSIFGDIQKSPYKDRVFVVLDSVHGSGLKASLEAMGLPSKNIVIWNKNGIEYYYPEKIIRSIYGSSGEIEIDGDIVRLNGIEHNKNKLADLVVDKMTKDTELTEEFQDEFLAKIESLI